MCPTECLTQTFRPIIRRNFLLSRTMLFYIAVTLMLPYIILALTGGDGYDICPGFRHEVVIPDQYYRNVPDSLDTGNITIVNFTYHIDRIKFVDEDK